MKPIPDRLNLREAAHGRGANGLAFYIHRSDEHGVQEEARREARGAPWLTAYTSDHLPEKEFKTFGELRDAVQKAYDAGELKEFVPSVLSADPKPTVGVGSGTGLCYLCRGEWTHTVRAKTGWRKADEAIIPSCVGCVDAVTKDPIAAIMARRKWCADHPFKLGPVITK